MPRALKRPLYRGYQLGHWIRRREWRVVAALLRGGPPARTAGAAPAAAVSVALTVYNRSTLALESVRRVAADPRIGEIVVSDDASEPGEYRRLCALLAELGPKVRIYRNERNRGPLWNKHHAVSLCTSEFAILFDSDNVLDTPYLDCLFKAAPWRRDCFYCPEFARPRFDLRLFGGVTFDLALVRRAMLGDPRDRRIDVLLNVGNHLVPVREYGETIGPFRDVPVTAWMPSPQAISGCAAEVGCTCPRASPTIIACTTAATRRRPVRTLHAKSPRSVAQSSPSERGPAMP